MPAGWRPTALLFQPPGTYQLYARVRVGPETANDDSMFYASSFGGNPPRSIPIGSW